MSSGTAAVTVLSSLPPELLHAIIAHLRGTDIQALAWTFNTSITPICLSVLAESGYLAIARHEHKMQRIFVDNSHYAVPHYAQFNMFEAVTASIIPEGMGGRALSEFPTCSTMTRLEIEEKYLDIRHHTLRWLQPLDPLVSSDSWYQSPLDFKPATTIEQMDQLSRSAALLGLRLPPHFRELMLCTDLQDRLMVNTKILSDLSYEPLIKVRISTSINTGSSGPKIQFTGVEGYMCKFYTMHLRDDAEDADTERTWSLYLYMNRQGEHCIVGSWSDIKPDKTTYADVLAKRSQPSSRQFLTPLDKQAGITGVAHCQPQYIAPLFDEFLMWDYFEHWAWWYWVYTSDIEEGHWPDMPPYLRGYITHMLTEDGRNS